MYVKTTPFVPGAEVALVSRSSWTNDTSYKKVIVEKVYASGNFVLKGSRQQYKPIFHRGEWEAYSTARDSRCDCVEMIRPELDEQVAATAARNAFVKLQRLIERAKAPNHPSAELLALMRSLVDALEQKSVTKIEDKE
jgi:hypothetical protein